MNGRSAPITVAEAMANYLADYITRGGKDAKRVQTTIRAHILPSLGPLMLDDLSAPMIRRWHQGLAHQLPRIRSKDGTWSTRSLDSNDPEAMRRRRATANRILTSLRAGLSHAYQMGHAQSNEAWARVRPFRDVDAPRIRFLSDDEARRLVECTHPAFKPMIVAALYTGCRYGELTHLRVDDIDFCRGSVNVRTSKTKKPRDVFLADEATEFFKQAATDRPPDGLMFAHPSGRMWGRSEQARPVKEACEKAAITPAISFHILRHT